MCLVSAEIDLIMFLLYQLNSSYVHETWNDVNRHKVRILLFFCSVPLSVCLFLYFVCFFLFCFLLIVLFVCMFHFVFFFAFFYMCLVFTEIDLIMFLLYQLISSYVHETWN